MRISKILTLCLILLILNSTLSIHLLLGNLFDNEKFVNSICKITNDVANSTDKQDILIGNLGGKVWSSTINDIVQCIVLRNPVVITDFKTVVKERNLRKASVVILTLNSVDSVRKK